jgi:hypothetical protein
VRNLAAVLSQQGGVAGASATRHAQLRSGTGTSCSSPDLGSPSLSDPGGPAVPVQRTLPVAAATETSRQRRLHVHRTLPGPIVVRRPASPPSSTPSLTGHWHTAPSTQSPARLGRPPQPRHHQRLGEPDDVETGRPGPAGRRRGCPLPAEERLRGPDGGACAQRAVREGRTAAAGRRPSASGHTCAGILTAAGRRRE